MVALSSQKPAMIQRIYDAFREAGGNLIDTAHLCT
jgi:aryl-alcohol dehydrogenase-like predicted oxidoreductase